jgi:hypothetical protein
MVGYHRDNYTKWRGYCKDFPVLRDLVNVGTNSDKKMVKNWYFFVFFGKKRAFFVIFW